MHRQRQRLVLVFLISACRAERGVVLEPDPAPQTDPQLEPQADPDPGPEAKPTPEPRGASGTRLELGELLADSARWLGVDVELKAKLQWVTVSCTASMPPSCDETWKIIGSSPDLRGSLEIRDRTVPIPYACRPNPNPGMVAAGSPCAPPEVLDMDQSYLFYGQLHHDAGGDYFEPTRVIRTPP